MSWQHPLAWAGRVLLALGVGLGLWGAVEELRTESYLEGFARATVPQAAPPATKVHALMAWLRDPPAWSSRDTIATRDPVLNLESQYLLDICGTVTNVFVNLAHTIGLHARVLILARPDYTAKHVVAEVLMDGRWIVVDPTYRKVLRSADGRTVTAVQLRDPAVFFEATGGLPGYPPSFDYERTTHIRLEHYPDGHLLRRALDALVPDWEDRTEAITWVLQRRSFEMLALAALLVLAGAALRTFDGLRRRRRTRVPLVLARAQAPVAARPSVRVGEG